MEINGESVWTRKTSYRVLVYQPIRGGLVNLAENDRKIHKIVSSQHPNLNRIVIYRFQSQFRQGGAPTRGSSSLRRAYWPWKPGKSRIKPAYCSVVTRIGQAHWIGPVDRKTCKTGSLTVIGIEFTPIPNRISPHCIKPLIMSRITSSRLMLSSI
jgi:hypothetical protein